MNSNTTKARYRTVFKVCAPGRRSVHDTPYALQYRRGQFVRSTIIPGARIFVFAKLADAYHFLVNTDRATTIWKARARNCIPLPRRLPVHDLTSSRTTVSDAQMEAFWQAVNERVPGELGLLTFNTPRGTLVAESVKLLSVVKPRR